MSRPLCQAFGFAGPDSRIESQEVESSEKEVPGKMRNSFNAGFATQSNPLLQHKRDMVNLWMSDYQKKRRHVGVLSRGIRSSTTTTSLGLKRPTGLSIARTSGSRS